MRILNDWILVQMDPLPEKIGSLFRPHGERVRTGIVQQVGPGRPNEDGKRVLVGLEKGERIAFFRENLEHQQGKAITSSLKELGDDLGLLRVNDVLFVIAPGEDIEVAA